MIKRILQYLFYGFAWGSTLFVLVGIIHEAMGRVIYDNFTIRALTFVLIGIGTGSSVIVYTIEQLKPWQQQAIHIGLSLAALIAIGITINWAYTHPSWVLVLIVLVTAGSFIAAWAGFYFYKKREAKRINEVLELLNNK